MLHLWDWLIGRDRVSTERELGYLFRCHLVQIVNTVVCCVWLLCTSYGPCSVSPSHQVRQIWLCGFVSTRSGGTWVHGRNTRVPTSLHTSLHGGKQHSGGRCGRPGRTHTLLDANLCSLKVWSTSCSVMWHRGASTRNVALSHPMLMQRWFRRLTWRKPNWCGNEINVNFSHGFCYLTRDGGLPFILGAGATSRRVNGTSHPTRRQLLGR